MSWGCYKHECDVGADAWKLETKRVCTKQADSDGGRTFGARQVGICPWCYDELRLSHRNLLAVLKSYDKTSDGSKRRVITAAEDLR